MAKEDLLLGVEMGKLEIEPIKTIKNVKEENPFVQPAKSLSTQIMHNRSLRNNSQLFKCSCNSRKFIAICKKKPSKIIKDPVLKILQTCTTNNYNKESNSLSLSVPSRPEDSDLFNLCALVDNCNQLRISSEEKRNDIDTASSSRTNWWKSDSSHTKQSRSSVVETSKAGSCSQQALNPPCDVTIDELASYFETLVHIPKKMSSMAEMMYI